MSFFLFVKIPFGFQPVYIRIQYKIFICVSDSETCSSMAFSETVFIQLKELGHEIKFNYFDKKLILLAF
jgi:hypothetical protein